MNPNIPLETFLPPPHLSHIHLLVSKDWNGLNNGVFFIRVHPWSLKLLTAASAYPILKPEVHLVWQDQSALAELFKMEYFSSSVVFCPLRWFNAYPEDWLEAGRSSASSSHLHLQPGDLLVHFPGTSREKLNETMMPYIEIAEGHQKAWELRLGETYYQTEIESFWKNMSSNVTRFWPHGAIASSPVSGP
ncbi:hypothetical protein LOZ48_005170 [Ophidiomyces ophidiicola]|nr:hypothetical protein LOZ48_005170 [Ophidiomyces ophidiicola]